MLDEYLALREKVDGFASAVSARRRDDMRCGKGCSACCEVELGVSAVEAAVLGEALDALPDDVRAGVRERAEGRATEAEGRPRCAMLEAEGGCAVYAARPLICRTQGLPLSYPPDTIPVDAVMGRGGEREITWCPLNFEANAPESEDVLDAARIEEILALVNRRFCDQNGIDPLQRIQLRALGAEPLPSR